MTLDLVIIGKGSGGLTAAEFAAGLGLHVAVIGSDRTGGDRPWSGERTSAALLASAKAAHTMRTAHRLGLTPVEPDIDLAAVWRRARAVQADIERTDFNPQRYRDLGVELIEADALVTGPNEVTLHSPGNSPHVLTTRYILLCTGSRPEIPTIDGLDPAGCFTGEQLLHLQTPPRSVAVIGGGPMGVETAQALRRLGIDVTIFQRSRTLLPLEEPMLVARLTETLVSEGVTVHCSADVRSLQHNDDGTTDVTAIVGDDGRRENTRVGGVLLAAGRLANTVGLGLDDVGIAFDEHGVVVDDRGRTALRTVYAVGEVTRRRSPANASGPWGHDAAQAVRDMFFPGKVSLDGPVPSCVRADPELARVGLTVEQAEAEHGPDTDVWHVELNRNERARTDAQSEGAVIVITAKGRVVGGHVLAPMAGEMIQELAVAIHRELRLDELAETQHLRLSYADSIGQLAAEAAYEKAQRLRWLMKRR